MLDGMGRGRDPWGSSGSHVIITLLVLSLLLVGVLTWRAQQAARSHRVMAERVLRDFAALASAEFVRRALNEVGYYGYQPLMSAIREIESARPGTLPDPGALAAHDRTARAVGLASRFFRFERRAQRLSVSDRSWPAQVQSRLIGILESSGTVDTHGFESAVEVVQDTVHTFVYGATASGDLVGFEVDMQALPAWLATAAARQPLLPPSLAGGQVSNDWLYLRMDDPAGRPLFAIRPGHDGALMSPLATERRLDADGNGIFNGFTVRAAIDLAVAPRLVIGGLPQSRLPELATLLALTGGLMVMAMLMLRRERAVVRLRSDFVSRVSHELRTPLTQIRLFAETLLLGRTRSLAEQRRALEAIDRESRRLTEMVENVLQFSRSERNQMHLATDRHAVAPLVESILDEHAHVQRLPAATIRRRLESVAVARVDPGAVRQILLNLLDNAIKYGGHDQTIDIAVYDEKDQVQISVEDEGPGVPPAERERVWRVFYRLDRDRESGEAGTGIGLAVVKELTERQRGRAWVESSSRGARFVVAFPVDRLAPDADPASERPSTTPEGIA